MKPAVLVLCLIITATGAAAQPCSSDDTANQAPPSRPDYRIREVRFAGDPGFEIEKLNEVLRELKPQRLIPRLWTRRPRYDAPAVEADLARLRAFYLSKGYLGARVELGAVTFDGREAAVTVNVQSGPKSRIRRLTIGGLVDGREKRVASSNGDFPVGALCTSLLAAQKDAQTRGRIDFSAELEVAETDEVGTASAGNWADVRATVKEGTARAVGRISFSGHYRINESTLRRMMALQERAVFDVGKLRRSIARLNGSGLFEPLTLADVEIQRNDDGWSADLTIPLRERPRGRWWLSGPLLPMGFGGSLQAAISSRLPPWGRGVFEASTYYATISLIGFTNPLGLLPAPKRSLSSLLLLERPYLPGQALFSGFALSPDLSPRATVARYGATHLGRGVHAALGNHMPDATALLVPVRTNRDAGFLICEPPKPRLRWLRRGAAYAADLTIGALQPY